MLGHLIKRYMLENLTFAVKIEAPFIVELRKANINLETASSLRLASYHKG